MDSITCPNCQSTVKVQTVIVTEARRPSNRDRVLRAFLRAVPPGRTPIPDLHRAYEAWRSSPDGRGAPGLTARSLAYELERMGLPRFRTAQYRGFVITPEEDD